MKHLPAFFAVFLGPNAFVPSAEPASLTASTTQESSASGHAVRTHQVPLDVSLPGLVRAIGRSPTGGSANATVLPACTSTIEDEASSGCLSASSIPSLGKLFPLSSDFFIAATGEVGIGTTNPVATLDVFGTSRFRDDMTVVGTGTFDDVAVLFGLDFLASSGLQFPAVSTSGLPGMISMFASGTSNADRMVLSHSPAFPRWGLKYEDSLDRFVFQSDAGVGGPVPTLVVDLGTSVESPVPFTSSNRLIATGSTDGVRVLEVTGSAKSYEEMVRIFRTTQQGLDEDVLELRLEPTSTNQSQYFECENAFEIDFRINRSGDVYADGAFTGPADFAEMIQVASGAGSVEAGDVLVIDATRNRAVVRSSEAYSTLVAGIFSTNPGFVGSEREWEELESASPAIDGERRTLERSDMARFYDEVPMAVVGIVPCKVSAENGPIQAGDLLVTSSTPGHAMRDGDPRNGTVLGKALEPFANGTGLIRVLVTLQ